MLAGGEWALGRWEGNGVLIGSAAGASSGSGGSMALTTVPAVLEIRKDDRQNVSCFFFRPTDGERPTKKCTVGPNGISLIAANSAVVELRRSGPNALAGRYQPATARAVVAPGNSDIQVHLNRVR